MPDVKPTIFKPFDATYSVSADGYCIRTDTGFFMRCVTSDSREPFYQMATNGKKKRVSVHLAVSTAWEAPLTVTDERAQEMRDNADLWNSEERPTGKRRYNYEERRNWTKPKPKQEYFSPPPESLVCQWDKMTTRNMEFPRMDCPQCDPLTNRMEAGVWVDVRDVRECAA